MNKKYAILGLTLLAACSFTSCMDDVDEPPVQTPKEVGITYDGDMTPNITIKQLKQKYQTEMTTNNTYTKVTKDLIFRGIVVGNDVSGNLYQTLVLREIRSNGDDDLIEVGIKNTHLSPYFPLGSVVYVNLNGLYIGNYSYVPKVGQPYKTSSGNLRLGPMLLELCRTNVKLMKTTQDQVTAALTPVQVDAAWLSANLDLSHTPTLATVEGTFTEADGKRVFTPYVSEHEDPQEGYDDGYAKNRALKVGSATVQVRTSTQNEISYTVIPSGTVRVTGILTYYNKEWQLSMRDLNDLEIIK